MLARSPADATAGRSNDDRRWGLIRSTGIGISVTRSYDRSLRICRPLGLVRTWDNLFAQRPDGPGRLALTARPDSNLRQPRAALRSALGYNPADLQPATTARRLNSNAVSFPLAHLTPRHMTSPLWAAGGTSVIRWRSGLGASERLDLSGILE